MMFRVSNVEAFRQFELDEDADTADFLARINGEVAPSAAMQVGTAFHKALELADHGEVESISAEGCTFRFVVPCEIELPLVREIRASKVYMVDGEPVVVSGQVDALDGSRIDDHKTTARFDADRYIAGYQWRLYLDIFGADRFRWNVFEIALNEDEDVYDVHAAHRLEQYRYPGMTADCQALVERFTRFMRSVQTVAA